MSKRQSKKRSHTKKETPAEKPIVTDPRAMEKVTSDLHRELAKQNFATFEEAQAFIEDLLSSSSGIPQSSAPASPLETAQDLIYAAFDARGYKRLELARDALDISEDCADAWVMLAEEAAGSLHEARVLFEEGVRAGERAIGKANFREFTGMFWGILETRPYMRAREGLARCLWDLGNHDQAIKHWQEMLRLNPNDNQGIRYTLLLSLLVENRPREVSKLLRKYAGDYSATWTYSRALHTYRAQGASAPAGKHLQEAFQANQHVPSYLLGRKPLPDDLPDYIGFGDEAEAVVYVADNARLWLDEEGALEWLEQLWKAS